MPSFRDSASFGKRMEHYLFSLMLKEGFCVESGCTFFGVVDQNCEIPPDVIDPMGLEVFEYEKIELICLFLKPFPSRNLNMRK